MMTEITLRLEKFGVIPVIAIEHINHARSQPQALENAGYELVYVRPGITPTEDELLELVPDCVGWLAGVEPISERVLRAATNLKVISRNGTGIDNIPLNLAQELRIKVLRVEAANARGVAELTICLALAALRHLPALHCAVKQGKWKLIRGSYESIQRATRKAVENILSAFDS
jgi:phosphoglycerate dehydrogenase-like enzyme